MAPISAINRTSEKSTWHLKILTTWNPKHPFINGCFNWMIPNLYIGNGWKWGSRKWIWFLKRFQLLVPAVTPDNELQVFFWFFFFRFLFTPKLGRIGNPFWRILYHQNYIYLEPVCPLFWGFNPPKQGLFQSKQGSFGFQVYIYIFIFSNQLYKYFKSIKLLKIFNWQKPFAN